MENPGRKKNPGSIPGKNSSTYRTLILEGWVGEYSNSLN
jgi:hypothetical protein